MASIIVDASISIIIFVIALVLNLIYVEPLYFYQEKLPCDAPRRNEFCQPWLFFVLVAVIPLVVLILQYDFHTNNFSITNLLYPLLLYLFTVSIVSIICSSIYILIGTPRPDSVEQCRTINISFWACSRILSKSQAVSQFHSFPSIESAIAMASAVIIGNFLTSTNNSLSELLPVMIKLIPYLWALMIGSFTIALSMYRISDVLTGYLIGFIVASWSSYAFNYGQLTRDNKRNFDDLGSGMGEYMKSNI